MNPSTRIAVSSLVAGVLLVILVLGLTYTSPGRACEPGRTVAVQNGTATPLLLVNSPYNAPYGDFSTGTLPVENGSLNLTLGGSYNGSVWGYFERTDWTVKVGVGTDGPNVACNQKFYLIPNNNVTSTIAPVSNQSVYNFVNDSEVPTSVQFNSSNAPVYFDDRFSVTTNAVSTCGVATSVRGLTSTHITIGIGFQYGGTSHILNTVENITTHYRYVFPADGGVWDVDNLSAPGGPGGGWAFSYSPCS